MTPSLDGWPTKAKKALSPHEVKTDPAGHQTNISMSWGKIRQAKIRLDELQKQIWITAGP